MSYSSTEITKTFFSSIVYLITYCESTFSSVSSSACSTFPWASSGLVKSVGKKTIENYSRRLVPLCLISRDAARWTRLIVWFRSQVEIGAKKRVHSQVYRSRAPFLAISNMWFPNDHLSLLRLFRQNDLSVSYVVSLKKINTLICTIGA